MTRVTGSVLFYLCSLSLFYFVSLVFFTEKVISSQQGKFSPRKHYLLCLLVILLCYWHKWYVYIKKIGRLQNINIYFWLVPSQYEHHRL